MTGYWWERWAAVSGILAVALFIVAFSIAGNAGDTAEEFRSFYADAGNRDKEIVTFFVIVAATLLFLAFLTTLRSRLVSAEGGPGTLSTLAYSSGVVTTALLLGASGFFVAPAFMGGDADFELDPNAVRLLGDAGYAMFVAGIMASALMIGATSWLALRTAVFPRWFAWPSLLVALLMLIAVFFFPIFAFLAWILAVSLMLIWRPVTALPTERVSV